ncbi:sugar ABC transporter ATP-binding protein [Brucella sp. JSBI001]|jgi:simple sugar transport system ATP-binding protein|uniref:sugar ABC transporter ATP-binding protein n=1 Tax=Brucella sp. JSBI001 TaxID=2886044 RepID=UPI002231534E|nr:MULTISPECIES: sugar ABC transporter ATP-binding protein [Brucella]UZD68129.1 sugar ABC transporter ATP-binding protein [Brucella sp. JSBI001]
MHAVNSTTHPVPPFLEVRNVKKSFGGVKALKDVSLTIEAGQIYHLMGENGCGKSTLIKILSGAQPADEGQILIDGEVIGSRAGDLGAIGALRAGIETVYQDLSLLPNLSVAENVAFTEQLVEASGRLARRLNVSLLNETARRALAEVHLPTDKAFLSRRTDTLPLATRQLIAIARAVASEARLVIMDEPTTSLTRQEVENLLHVVERLRNKGVAVLFVTHKLDECKLLGGRAIIMRDGLKVAELDVAGHSKAEFSHWMTGREISQTRYRTEPKLGEVMLEVEKLGDGEAFQDVSFSLRKGEILGVTGLLDSGRNELALALAAVKPATNGKVRLNGREIAPQSTAQAIEYGIGYVPEDRLTEGLFLEKPIQDNITLPILDRLRNALGIISDRRARRVAEESVADLQIVAPDVTIPVQSLSGGNQQRVLIGRWLTINPQLLILHGPTVGVDVGSKDTIFRIIQRLADDGMGVIIISDDLPELLQNSDRILIMRQGRIVAAHAAEDLTEDAIYQSMASTSKEVAQ